MWLSSSWMPSYMWSMATAPSCSTGNTSPVINFFLKVSQKLSVTITSTGAVAVSFCIIIRITCRIYRATTNTAILTNISIPDTTKNRISCSDTPVCVEDAEPWANRFPCRQVARAARPNAFQLDFKYFVVMGVYLCCLANQFFVSGSFLT